MLMQYDRYQPSYQRIVNDEIPDTAAPPDGRFWKAGVAQGLTTNPYERRLALSGRRKPIVIGPRSINIVVDGEGHTFANMLRDVAWTQYVYISGLLLLCTASEHHLCIVSQIVSDSKKGVSTVLLLLFALQSRHPVFRLLIGASSVQTYEL